MQPGWRCGPGRREALQRVEKSTVGVRGQVARQRMRQLGKVAAEDQASSRRGGPSPFGGVGQELAHGEDLAAAVADGELGAVFVPGLGEPGQPRLDRGPLQPAQVEGGRLAGGEEPAEGGQVARGGLDRGGRMRGAPLGAVVQEQAPQRFGYSAVMPGQPRSPPGVLGWVGQDPEMEQHPMPGQHQATVVGPAGPVPLRLPIAPQRRGQVIKIGRSDLLQLLAGLNQSPDDDAFGDALDDMAAVVQIGGGRGEPGQVAGQPAASGLGEQPTDLAVGQVVIAGPEPAGEHQESHERPLRGPQTQLHL